MYEFKSAFVTGSTGLLGNNLVRLLLEQGIRVKALARSAEKAKAQFEGLKVEIVVGDMNNVDGFRQHLNDVDVLFHTAAYFRDSYKGGKHWDELYQTNVIGTRKLLEAAKDAGIRRMVHTSSVAVLTGPKGSPIDETMDRRIEDADDYYRSKILSENTVREFLNQNPDMHITFVLPGWMFGPGDIGPTSSGQLVQDFLQRKLPGIPPGSFSVVDARDVAFAEIQAARVGRNGERYLAAGRYMDMRQLAEKLTETSGIKGPTRAIPYPVILTVALLSEVYALLTHKPILISLGSIRMLKQEEGRTHFNPEKSRKELGLEFRPVEETLRDVLQDMSLRGISPLPA
ncbi:MAG TPA: SDR family oxidoreductase [Dongiaceae bacterium]|nr:SDR family oxidoreductase [Dongiaceae bacterium]